MAALAMTIQEDYNKDASVACGAAGVVIRRSENTGLGF